MKNDISKIQYQHLLPECPFICESPQKSVWRVFIEATFQTSQRNGLLKPLSLSSVFIVCTNSHLSGANWPNGACLFVNKGVLGPCCCTSPQCELTGHAHLAVTNRYLVISWPEVLMQQRRSGGADVKWVELGRINCRCVRSWQQSLPIKSANLIFFKSSSFLVMAHWQMHNEEEHPGQLFPRGNQCFIKEVTSSPVQGHCIFSKQALTEVSTKMSLVAKC